MTKEEMAALLNGRQYRNEMTDEEERQAKDAGLVVVFGASDDLMEFRGAIYDEIGCYSGGTAALTRDGILQNECHENEDCPYFAKIAALASTIEALWCADQDGGEDEAISWTYRTAIPHAAFEITEDDQVYCRGIVFALDGLPE